MKHLEQAKFGISPWPKIKEKQEYSCKRSGVMSFRRDTLDSWKASPLGRDAASFDKFVAPYIEPTDSIRVFFRDLGGEACSPGYKVPQMAMYTPESGFPLCSSAKVRQFKMSGSWPSKAKRFFVTIPVPHIYRALYGHDHADHQLTVFDTVMPAFEPADLTTPNAPHREAYGKPTQITLPYVTDVNLRDCIDTDGLLPQPPAPEGEDTEHWFNTWIYNNWGDSMSMPERMAARDFTHGLPLSEEEFEAYLAYWMLLYPNKYILSKAQAYGSTGTAPDEIAACQGFIRYTPNSYNEDYFYGKNRPLSHAFELQNPLPMFGTKTSYERAEGSIKEYLSYVDAKAQGFYVNYEPYPWVSSKTLLHMGIVRSYLDKTCTNNFNSYLFKAPRYSHRSATHKLPTKVVKTLSDIMRYKGILDSGAELVEVSGRHCQKCGEQLVIPKLLKDMSPNLDKVVCYPCGAKYLANLVYLLTEEEKKWFYFEDYPIQEAFPLVSGAECLPPLD